MNSGGRSLSPIFTGLGSMASAFAGAPAWLCAVGLAVAVVQEVFPQRSADRLAWWREYWRHRERGRRVRATRRRAGRQP
jgi:hypothetical protein